MEDLGEGARSDAQRLERMGRFAQLPVELDDARHEVVEPAVDQVAMAFEHERIQLVA